MLSAQKLYLVLAFVCLIPLAPAVNAQGITIHTDPGVDASAPDIDVYDELSFVDRDAIEVHESENPAAKRIFISPGHLPGRNTYPCGSIRTSEHEQAWKIGRLLSVYLDEYGFTAILPATQSPHVSYTTRLNTAANYGVDAYINLHSNAVAQDCSSTLGGTFGVFEPGDNKRGPLAQEILKTLSPYSPGTQWDNKFYDYPCPSDPGEVPEICTSKAKAMHGAYIEMAFHTTHAGANWITSNNDLIACKIALGIARHYGVGPEIPCKGSAPSPSGFAVKFVTPKNGQWVRSNAKVIATSNDERNLDWMRVKVDGSVKGWMTEAPHEWVWPTKSYAEGTHTLRVEGQNRNGAEAYSSITVGVDNTAPKASLQSPQAGFLCVDGACTPTSTTSPIAVALGDVPVRVAASDSRSGIRSVHFYVDGKNQAVDTSPTPTYSWNWQAGEESAGQHTLSVVAYDKAGNSHKVSLTVTTIPNSAPGLTAENDRTRLIEVAEDLTGSVVENVELCEGCIPATVDCDSEQCGPMLDECVSDGSGCGTIDCDNAGVDCSQFCDDRACIPPLDPGQVPCQDLSCLPPAEPGSIPCLEADCPVPCLDLACAPPVEPQPVPCINVPCELPCLDVSCLPPVQPGPIPCAETACAVPCMDLACVPSVDPGVVPCADRINVQQRSAAGDVGVDLGRVGGEPPIECLIPCVDVPCDLPCTEINCVVACKDISCILDPQPIPCIDTLCITPCLDVACIAPVEPSAVPCADRIQQTVAPATGVNLGASGLEDDPSTIDCSMSCVDTPCDIPCAPQACLPPVDSGPVPCMDDPCSIHHAAPVSAGADGVDGLNLLPVELATQEQSAWFDVTAYSPMGITPGPGLTEEDAHCHTAPQCASHSRGPFPCEHNDPAVANRDGHNPSWKTYGHQTASGACPQEGVTVAACCVGSTPQFELGTTICVEGYGTRVVQDRGGSITRNKLDMFLANSDEAIGWGHKSLKVTWPGPCDEVKQDTTPPTVKIGVPATGKWSRGTVVVRATITDASGIEAAKLRIDSLSAPGISPRLVTGNVYEFAWDSRSATDARYTLIVSARDPAGNVAWDSTWIRIDNSAPSVQLLSPKCNEVYVAGQGWTPLYFNEGVDAGTALVMPPDRMDIQYDDPALGSGSLGKTGDGAQTICNPAVAIGPPVPARAKASDDESAIARVNFYAYFGNNDPPSLLKTCLRGASCYKLGIHGFDWSPRHGTGDYSVYAVAYDLAGNAAKSKVMQLRYIDTDPVAPPTALWESTAIDPLVQTSAANSQSANLQYRAAAAGVVEVN